MDQCDHAMASFEEGDDLGRGSVRSRVRSGHLHDRRGGRLQHGRDGEQGIERFNSRYVLARPETATDADFDGIEGVIGHEYFHNWSGNRVTCRDWFQLSLKEGFTVFRDQQFSADMGSRGVKRIGDVNLLRAHQFPKTTARWRTRCGRIPMSRSTTSTP
jgi:aminopeptidase N